jgi:glycosyltransferase involved in cell wall biosynthesis
MRIAIDARDILNPTRDAYAGVSHYVDGIVRALIRQGREHAFIIFVHPDNTPPWLDRVHVQHPHTTVAFLPKRRGSFYLTHIRTASMFKAARPDILFAPAGQLPAGWMGRSVMTAHDLSIFEHPEWFPEPTMGQMVSTKLIVPSSFRKAQGIICVSEATKRQVQKRFRISAKRLCVIPEAVEVPRELPPLTSEMRERFGISSRFVLFLGTIEPRKNLPLLFKAFGQWLDAHHTEQPEVRLLVAGKRGWKWEETLREMDALTRRFGPVAREVGYVTPEEKWALLAAAELFVFPSWYEGFGLPVLEAMSVGTPVVTTRAGGLSEVGGEAVHYVSHENPTELVRAFETLLTDSDARRELAERGRKHALTFGWDRTAKETLDFFSEVHLQFCLQVSD